MPAVMRVSELFSSGTCSASRLQNVSRECTGSAQGCNFKAKKKQYRCKNTPVTSVLLLGSLARCFILWCKFCALRDVLRSPVIQLRKRNNATLHAALENGTGDRKHSRFTVCSCLTRPRANLLSHTDAVITSRRFCAASALKPSLLLATRWPSGGHAVIFGRWHNIKSLVLGHSRCTLHVPSLLSHRDACLHAKNKCISCPSSVPSALGPQVL